MVAEWKSAVRQGRTMRDLLREIAIALRALRRNRGSNAGIVLTLGLVIGASAALFGTLYAVAFPRLPFRHSGRMVIVQEVDPIVGPEGVSEGAFRAVQRQARGFEDLAGFEGPIPPDLVFSTRLWGTQQTVAAAGCTSGLFRLLGTAPILGRPILPSDERAGAPPVAVLGYRFWHLQYGGNRGVIGKTISVNSIGREFQYTVVGVMPPGVDFPYPLSSDRPDFWTAEHADASSPVSLLGEDLHVIGRLRAGVGMRDAQTEVQAIAERLRERYPQYFRNKTMRVVSLRSELVRNDETVLIVLGCAMCLILLLGCANVAGILQIRAMWRERETAVRAALGATRSALARQFSIETGLLVLAGGALGTLVSYGALRAFAAAAPQIPGLGDLGRTAVAFRVLAGAAIVSAAVAFLVALAPALFRSNPDLNSLIKSGWRRAPSGGVGVFPWSGSLLLVLQVALGLTLVAGTFALGADLQRLLSADEALSPGKLVTLEVGLWNTVLNTPPYVSQLFRGFADRARTIPGVRAAALTDGLPEPTYVYTGLEAPGSNGAIGKSYQPAEVHIVTPGFFQLMSFRLTQGRYFGEGDILSSKPVAVINTAMAERYWPDEDPIGDVLKTRLGQGVPDHHTYQIVGVVREPRRFGTGKQAAPAVYVSYWQEPARGVTVVARTAGDPASVVGALRAAALEIAPGETNLGADHTGEDIVAESSSRVRFTTALVASFGVLALLLLVAGTYGVVSYHAARRTREMGIRMALGSTPLRARLLVVRQGLLPVSAGLVLGLVGAVMFAKSISSLLYGAQIRGFGVFCGSAALVLGAALLACYLPSRRATRVDPATTLREE